MGHSKATNTKDSLYHVNGLTIEINHNGKTKQLNVEPKVLAKKELETYEIPAYAGVSM